MKKQDAHQSDNVQNKKTADPGAVLEALTAELEEWKGKYMRVLADYQNLERRSRDEKEAVRRYAGELILGRMLPAIDTLAKAKDHLKDIGLDLAFKEFTAILDEKGVTKIEAAGKPFDPHTMECIEVVDGEDNIVVAELLPGFMLDDKVLRVAQVTVGKKQSVSADAQSAN